MQKLFIDYVNLRSQVTLEDTKSTSSWPGSINIYEQRENLSHIPKGTFELWPQLVSYEMRYQAQKDSKQNNVQKMESGGT